MRPTRTCPRCRTQLPAETRLCPRCLFEAALGPEPAEDRDPVVVTQASGPRPEPPTQAEIERAFVEFEAFELLGRGGMGVVYKARQKKLERFVALKILPRALGADASFRERFLREARALARLVHPNIVTVHDFGEQEGLCFLVLEYVDGTNLRALLREHPPAPREALGIVRALCDALQYAHDEGVVHRDIKPENVLVDRSGRIKIADFGLAKVTGIESEAHLTAVGQVMGTPHYMAPEQIERPQDVDHRADLFALGVVMYELLTGSLPRGTFALPSRTLHVDVRLDEVVLKALERDPTRRYQQAVEVRTDVDAIESTPPPEPERSRADHGEAVRVTARGSPANSLRGIRGVALCLGAWIVVCVAWNLGAFALGLAAAAFMAVFVALLRAHVASRPSLAADLSSADARQTTRRAMGAIVLGLAAALALFVGHVAQWERGTSSWSPSYADVDDLHTRILPEPSRPPASPAAGEAFSATTTTRIQVTESRSSSSTPFPLPPWLLVSLGLATLTAAAYVLIRPRSAALRRTAWHVAGRVSAQVALGLAVTWVACWIGAWSMDHRLGEIQSDLVTTKTVADVERALRGAARAAGTRIDLDESVTVSNDTGKQLLEARVLRAQARSPLDRWSLTLTGPRRATPEVWAVATSAPGGGPTTLRLRAGSYDLNSNEVAPARDLVMNVNLELR